jgi:16S rRNA (guanine966-N2)-methyltransferase
MNPRVTAGKYKNLRLDIPSNTRPFTERTKLVLFDTLSHYIQGKVVLDLFCGAGSVGLEALSRGASRIIFSDNDEKSVLFLRKNIEKLSDEDKRNVSVVMSDYKALKNKLPMNELPDLVVADPPFKNARDLKFSILRELVNEGGFVVVKHPTLEEKPDFEEYFDLIETKLVGNNTLYFLKAFNSAKIEQI